ncbi:MAG TPA: hypothetical protein PLA64_13640 [Mesotoga infera]|nr:hypothetical protein [Mesotoga infera]
MQRGLIEFKNGSGKKNYAIYSLGAHFRNLDINLGPDDKVSDKLNDKLNVQLNVQVNDKGSKILDPRDLDNNIYIPAIEKIILLWNQYQISRIPANRERTEKGILAALGQHGEEAVMKAVHNYFKILSDDTSLLDTRWQCYIFMETHIEKFLDLESARNLYKGGGNGTSRKYPSRNGSKTSASTERPDREHYTGGKYGGFFAADESDEDS